MSQKKKLVLSPLPEQTHDYSRYEETETRWDRIIAALVLLVLVIGVLVYFLFINTDDETDLIVLKNTVSEEQVTPILPLLKVEKILENEAKTATIQQEEESKLEIKKDLQETLIDQESFSVIPPESSSVEVRENLEQTRLNDAKPSDALPLKENVEQLTEQAIKNESSVEAEVAVQNVVISEPAAQKAVVNIQNNAITKAVLTLEMKNKEPTASLSSELILPEEGIVKVILFTEMDGLRGKKLYHDWYRNGVRQARVKIPVNVHLQRSHSSKYINAQMLGEWHVKVVDENSELYVTADFRVVLP